MPSDHPTLFDLSASGPDLLDALFARDQISIRRGQQFDVSPHPLALTPLRDDMRIEGMLLGVAVGDALGHSTEWKFDPQSRHEKFGTIVDHLTTSEARAGRISDDTQMTFWTLDRLLARGQFDFDDVVGCFVKRQTQIVGMGRNTSASLSRHRSRLSSGKPELHQCAGNPVTDGRGNGALMRFSPIVLPHLQLPTNTLWSDCVMSALATHGNASTLASIVPMTHLLWQSLGRETSSAPPALWWIDEYLRVGGDLQRESLLYPLDTDRIPKWYNGFRGTLADFLDGPVRNAFRQGVPLRDACSLDGFGSRADVLQTVPAVLYALMCHADSFESSIIAAVNDTKDNDTIAAIVGAYVGAIHGKRAIRSRWIDGIRSYSLKIPGRETISDRDVMLEMAVRAREKFL